MNSRGILANGDQNLYFRPTITAGHCSHYHPAARPHYPRRWPPIQIAIYAKFNFPQITRPVLLTFTPFIETAKSLLLWIQFI